MTRLPQLICDCGALLLRDVGIGEVYVLIKEHETNCMLLHAEESDD